MLQIAQQATSGLPIFPKDINLFSGRILEVCSNKLWLQKDDSWNHPLEALDSSYSSIIFFEIDFSIGSKTANTAVKKQWTFQCT